MTKKTISSPIQGLQLDILKQQKFGAKYDSSKYLQQMLQRLKIDIFHPFKTNTPTFLLETASPLNFEGIGVKNKN